MQNLRRYSPASLLADYFRLFINRRAYTLQSNRGRDKVRDKGRGRDGHC